MKTEQEIKEEIKAMERTINNHRNAYHERVIPKETYRYALNENNHMILALKWVLGENDRWD
jgi:hypothetical protein